MPSREELNQLYSDSHKLKQVIADNNALRKQLAQQAEMVEQCMVCMNDNADEAKRLESVIVELQAALAEPSEPVATIEISEWGTSRTIDTHFAYCMRDWPCGEYELFTHPAKPEPLTADEVWKSDAIMAVNASMDVKMNDLMKLVRVVEQAIWFKFAAVKQDAAIKEKLK